MAKLFLCDMCGRKVYGLIDICRCDWRDGKDGARLPVIELIPPGPYVEPRLFTAEAMDKAIVELYEPWKGCDCDYGEGKQCPRHAGAIDLARGWHANIEAAEEKEWNRIMSERIVGNGKPTTPQPSEWKIAPVLQALLDFAEMERKSRQEVCGITDLMRGVSPSADRALSDFIARRKAKREDGFAAFDNSGPYWACEHCGLLVKANDAAYSAHESACDARIIARAMSTPLPHDPPMSARLMPWRGK